jgi:hypothetical protein
MSVQDIIDLTEKIKVFFPFLRDLERTTYLHEAVDYPNDAWLAAKILLEKGGADPNARDSNGCTVLQIALSNPRCSVDTVELLLKHGARPDIEMKFPIEIYIVASNYSRPWKQKIFLSKLLIQYTMVIEKNTKYKITNWKFSPKMLSDVTKNELTSIRDECVHDLKSLEKYKISNVLYRFCTETILVEDVALFDAYVKKKCPHFQELLKLVLETSRRWNHLLALADFQNSFFADRLNWDCLLRIMSILDPADKVNFLSAYWKCL